MFFFPPSIPPQFFFFFKFWSFSLLSFISRLLSSGSYWLVPLFMCTFLKGLVLRYLLPLPSSSSSVFAGNSCNKLQTLHVFCFNINSSKRRSRKEVKNPSVSIIPKSLWATTQKLWPALCVQYRKKRTTSGTAFKFVLTLPYLHLLSFSTILFSSFFFSGVLNHNKPRKVNSCKKS